MGLHDALAQDVLRAYLWYYAYNSRRGRRHLFKVPFVIKRYMRFPLEDRLYYGERETEAIIADQRQRQSHVGYSPSYMSAGTAVLLAERMCNTTQEAREWELDSLTEWMWERPNRPRGVCEECYNRMNNIGGVNKGLPPGRALRAVGGLRAGMGLDDFIRMNNGLEGNQFDETRYVKL